MCGGGKTKARAVEVAVAFTAEEMPNCRDLSDVFECAHRVKETLYNHVYDGTLIARCRG
jgi:hypothetical protein